MKDVSLDEKNSDSSITIFATPEESFFLPDAGFSAKEKLKLRSCRSWLVYLEKILNGMEYAVWLTGSRTLVYSSK